MNCQNLMIALWTIGIDCNWFGWVLREKWPTYEERHDKIIFLLDNARSQVAKAKVVKNFLETFKWDILPHLPYSLDITCSDYCFFHGCHPIWQVPNVDRLLRQISSRKIVWEVWKGCSQGWLILGIICSFILFWIKYIFNTKKQAELIYTHSNEIK